MRDPLEGVAADGSIVTGAARTRVPTYFEPLLADLVSELAPCSTSLYLYGSVATGQALVGRSDVDLLAFDLPAGESARVGSELSARYVDLCRGVEIGTPRTEELDGDSDATYGLRVFLRHYCVHVGGPTIGASLAPYQADARAVRGFNGDIRHHLARWQESVKVDDATVVGRRVARKTLLAVAGLVSLASSTWTTDRDRAADEFGVHRPRLAQGLCTLAGWASGDDVPDRAEVTAMVRPGGVVDEIVDAFEATAGLWRDPPD